MASSKWSASSAAASRMSPSVQLQNVVFVHARFPLSLKPKSRVLLTGTCVGRNAEDERLRTRCESHKPGRPGLLAGLSLAASYLGQEAAVFADDLNAQLSGAGGDQPTFTNFLVILCLAYWLIKAVSYFMVDRKNEDEQEDKPRAPKPRRGMDMTAHSRAPIRSFIEAGPSNGQDAQEYRNKSLARSAVYHVITAIKESQPRIHAMLIAEAAACRLRTSSDNGTASPVVAPPHQQAPGMRFALPVGPTAHDLAAHDPVAQLVAESVDKLTSAKGCEALDSTSRNLVVLEQQLLEELAQQVARDEIARLQEMASSGQLRVDGKPCGSSAAASAGAEASSGSGKDGK